MVNVAERTFKILRAVDDPIFFSEDPYFLGMELFPKQAEILKEFYDPAKRYTELILVVGNKGGKTVLASIFALFEAFKLLILPNPAEHYKLSPGSLIFIVVVAVSEEQARDTIFNEIRSKIPRSPFFRELKPRIYQNEVRFLQKGIVILCGTSSSSSLAGRTAKIVIWDELARFEESTSKRGAWNVYNSLKRTTTIFKEIGYSVAISSPRHVTDIVMTLYKRSKSHPEMLGRLYPTWEFNPRITQEDLKDEFAKDPAAAWCDYGCIPLAGVMSYFPNPEIVPFNSAIPNNLELMMQGIDPVFASSPYVLAGDPALRHDAFGLALLHRQHNKIIVDGLYRFTPEIGELSPVDMKNKICDVIRKAPITDVVFDTWNFPILQEEIRRMGVNVVNHLVNKEDYDHFKEDCYRKKIEICEYPRLLEELEQLKIINNKRIDHLPGGRKDVADALVNGRWCLTELVPERKFAFNIVAAV